MSKCIWICSKKSLPQATYSKLYGICEAISPDNINPRKPLVGLHDKVGYGIMNPANTILQRGNSLLLGKILNEKVNWHIPLQDYPDGSFALFRDDENYCEIVTDTFASRTIWYYKDEDYFISSTSQRAIILYLDNFRFNQNVIPWMLSTGSLGPRNSWDERVRQVPSGTSVILNKKTWKNEHKRIRSYSEKSPSKKTDHEGELKNALIDLFKELEFNLDDWVLPLSGGYDSRGILCFFNHLGLTGNLKTITWGLSDSALDSGSDVFIADHLAKVFNVPNKFYPTNAIDEPVEKIFDRFLLNGEGRIDHISGYLDGFNIWKNLFADGIQGIIRGDEAFGDGGLISSALTLRLKIGLGLCSDYLNLKDYLKFSLPEQVFPSYLERNSGESLFAWKERLYMEYRQPSILAALSDLKLSYIEIVNPLLFHVIVQKVNEMPVHLRKKKVLFKKIVDSFCPDIPIAARDSTAEREGFLRQRIVVEYLKQMLISDYARKIFDKDFLNYINKNLKIQNTNKQAGRNGFNMLVQVKKMLPAELKNILRDHFNVREYIDFNLLAFRMIMIVRMHQILSQEKLKKEKSEEFV